ncbi:MAG: c-type cytochrome [Gammaproteobacteria bacterium]|nr:c-type cytochrome [Gammaproteobacteria bacterium]
MKRSSQLSGSIRVLTRCVAFLCAVLFPVANASTIDAQSLYQKHCSACHGEKGDGHSRASVALTPPPRDFTTSDAWRMLSRERMLTSVTYGRPGTAMVAFGDRFDKAEIAAIVDYVRNTFMHPPTAKERSGGDAIYREHCAVCHGDKGSGAQWTQFSLNPAPRDFTTPVAREELTRERMVTSVTYGRPGTAMMSFRKRLTAEQIGTVVDYIRGTFMAQGGDTGAAGVATTTEPADAMPAGHPHGHGAAPATVMAPATAEPVDMDAPMPFGLRPDAAAGRAFFMANCFTCHGRKGDGKGPRSKFISPPPRDFLTEDARSRYNRPALFKAIALGKAGTVMPAWSKVLDEQQIANVAEFVYTAFIHPGADEAADKKKP